MEKYIGSPYCQYFYGEIYFQYKYPFDPSDFVHFRIRIDESGMKKIFKQIIDLFGKEHKQCEFGNKSSFAYTRGSGIIVGAMVEGNAYDGNMFKPQLEQVKELTGGTIRKAIVDKGYQVKGGIRGVDIVMPKNLKRKSYCMKKKREERCRSRAGIEGLISQLKHDHRMIRNYLSGTAGYQINTLLAATAYNMKKWMRLKREEILNLILRWIYQTPIWAPVNIPR
jgi:IS5 family transposase